MRSFALLALVSAASAQYRGYNYGATNNDGSVRAQQDFENLFNRAKNVQGTSGFTSARLYTMIQGSTTDTVTSAIPAAIDTQTTLLLGLWASAGQDAFNNEITALKNAITQYGPAFTSLIAGISVGSEDLYRVSPTGIENNSGAGSTPDALVSYIGQVRSAISGTSASGASVGHVDTWTAWVNGSNAAVINAVDWLGMDGYPYYETTLANSIENSADLFFDSYNQTVGVSAGKPVWVTETGYPYQGPTAAQAVPSTQNAETYWQAVACKLIGNVNTWWYTLYDPQAAGGLSFGLVDSLDTSTPLYDLTCSNGASQASSSSSASSASSHASTAASPTAPTTAALSSTVSIQTSPNVESTPSAYVTSTAVGGASSGASSAAPSSAAQSGGHTYTQYSTTLVTITSCSEACTSSATQPASQPASQPATSVASSASATASGKSCPTNLSGNYEYPHLIVPVDSANPSKAYGTSYNGTITPTISSIFNFDIPASDAGKTCSLIFLLPELSQLETSSYTFNGQGGIKVSELTAPATESTTYSSVPAAAASFDIPSVSAGSSYLVTSHECGAGQRIAFEFSSEGGLDLEFFQDYNPSPLGAYVTVC